MKKAYFSFLLLILLNSCTEKKSSPSDPAAQHPVEEKGSVISKDSIRPVVAVPASAMVSVNTGKPVIVQANTNIFNIPGPQIITAAQPVVNTPGQDTFSLPETVPALDSSFVAGIPETNEAKDPYIKDRNPENFSFFGKLQGLKQDNLNSVLQDRAGNIWMCTGHGVTKYDGRNFSHFTSKEGLCFSSARCILEDKAGNIWIGTQGGGVSKYDGKKFTTFTAKEGLSDNTIWDILEDKAGNIWFATWNNGVTKYDGKNFSHYTKKQGLPDNTVRSMAEDRQGNIWFATGNGLSKYNGQSFANLSTKEGLPVNTLAGVIVDHSGNIWLATQDAGVVKYDGKNFFKLFVSEELGGLDVDHIMEDKAGNIWLCASDNGVMKYNNSRITRFGPNEGFVPNVNCMLEDKNGTMWFGTNGSGLAKHAGKTFTHLTDKEGMPYNVVYNIQEDKNGNTWFATGGGLSKYDTKTFTHYTDKEGLNNNVVMDLLRDKKGDLWIGTGAGIMKSDGEHFFRFAENEGPGGQVIWSILEDSKGNLWFGTYGGGAYKYDGKSFSLFSVKEGLSNNDIRKIFEDKNGNIWFCTNGGGATKYYKDTFTQYTTHEGLSNNIVRCVMEDKDGILWFGTGGGIARYDGKRFFNITEKEGLSNNVVYSALEDKEGNLWFGTRSGLNKLSADNKKKLSASLADDKNSGYEKIFFQNYNYEDGFLGIGCNMNALYEDRNGTIWVGSNDRLTKHDKAAQAADTVPPNIQLNEVRLFNENIGWTNLLSASGKEAKDTSLVLGNGVSVNDFHFDSVSKWYGLPENLSLAYNNNFLTFNFVGITTSSPKKVKYRYKLEGIDENWSVITGRTEAPYGNLPHGSYTFMVKAMNSEGYWSDEYKYEFVIRPPWWKTWWFRAIVVVIVILSLYIFYRSRTAALRARQKFLEQTVEERTAEVVHQKEIIEEKHKEITDSINYAERIQRAQLASKELLDEHLPEYFILFKPKDVVSGDFYWASMLSNGQFALVTADSTGHGVPGAIMSIVNIASLKESVMQGITRPDLLLNETRKLIIGNLKNDGSAEGGKDGMDGTLLSFDLENNIVLGASAHNPVWIVKSTGTSGSKELIEIKADRMPIGKHEKDNVPFTLHTIHLAKGDMIYTLTDGYIDQFGGAQGKKFKGKQLQGLLLTIAHESMEEQKQKLYSVFEEWRGGLEQIDDVCIIGVRI